MPSLPGFIDGSAPSLSAIATSERTVNFYLERIGTEGAQHKSALYPTPGQQTWITKAGSGGVMVDVNVRAGCFEGGRAFVVIGGGLYEIFADATITKRGTVAQDGNPAQFAYNGATGAELLVASGGNAYCFVLSTNTLSTVLTGVATQIGMLDEYFLALDATTGKLRLSNLNDGLTWDPTQFALRSAQPDPWIAMVVNAPDIWLVGSNSGDIWYDAGTSPFPLAARTGINIKHGIAASFSFAKCGGVLYWLSSNKEGDGLVVAAPSYSAQAISTLEIDSAIAGYRRTAQISDAEALTYQMLGHTFYALRFPAANATWLFDTALNKWTELGTWNSTRGDYDVWSVRTHVYAFGRHIVGTATSGTLSILDVIYNTEADGTAIRRLRRGPVLILDLKPLELRRFELVLEPGLGLSTGQGSNPLIMARFSKDGGKTWSSEVDAGVGRLGQYLTRVFWTRLGSPTMWVPEITITDPIPLRIIDALINNDVDLGEQAE